MENNINNDQNRISKIIARAGICSRRDAEKLIVDGKVVVNGEKILSPAFNVGKNDEIFVNGELLPQPELPRVWLFYKPLDYICTNNDEQGRKTIFDILPDDMPRVISIGRLDINSEGLLLLTNDGEISRNLEMPANNWIRKYKVKVFGKLNENSIKRIKGRNYIDGRVYHVEDISLITSSGNNHWIELHLMEGQNREIRKIMNHYDCMVSRLIRTNYGPFSLSNLTPKEVREVTSFNIEEKILGKKFDKSKWAKPKPKKRLNIKRKSVNKNLGKSQPSNKDRKPFNNK